MFKIYSTLILSLVCLPTQAQNSYKFPASTQIYDLDGGNFLSHYMSNNKAYLQERDSTGAILWQDSIVGTSDNPLNLASMQLERFGTSNTYAVFLLDKFVNDSTVIYIANLSLDVHVLSEIKKEKLGFKSNIFTYTTENNDIVLLTNTNQGLKNFQYKAFSLNKSLQLAELNNGFFNTKSYKGITASRFYFDNNRLTEIYNNYGDFYSKTLDQNFELQTNDSSLSVKEYNYCAPLLVRYLNADSIYIFYYCYIDSKSAWVSTWSNSKLEENSSHHFVFNNDVALQNFYSLDLEDVTQTRENIFLLGTGRDSKNNFQHKVFVYNYQFEPVCDFAVPNGTRIDNTLITFNDNAYVKRVVGNEMQLTRINNCELATGIGNTDGVSPTSSIYPNPNNGKFVLKTAQNVQGKTATVYNILGKKLAEFKLNNAFENALDIEEGAGIYFLKIADANTSIKFIVQ